MVQISAPVNKKSAEICVIGNRLKEERERLGLTQPEFAEAASAAKRTLIEWEKGTTSPNAVQLSALAAIGVDVLYVLTGQRSIRAGPVIPSVDQVSEKILLMLQEMSEEKRREVLKYAEEKKLLAELLADRGRGRRKAD